ncbi:uncharacterized protein BO66DRAFT_439835 [Aspergillus aculeatinus CBS 121060]|uniref:Uncharacterized protein n=1 Tax=Aspergillus aculeatinus CBS 121060 TaxID=1448322 RepID=A0ACD1H4W8_9EURO|nr:hypothetical protein BO66DRAFT_439835 [Aspergillus aculeatinus CBS 121060]RAH68823.1 hypothetical protein BO66DRAFT_439835 [Aspergillus aculeatinus CBS 121060]
MLFLIPSLFGSYAHALTKFDTNCTLPAETVNYVFAPNTRGTLTILCTWTVQHPDIPRPRENFKPGFNGKIQYWITTPEVLLAKYGYDLWEAKRNLHRLQARAQQDGVEWTIAHSLFANMGGFVMRVNSVSTGRRPLGMRLTRPSEPAPRLHELSTLPTTSDHAGLKIIIGHSDILQLCRENVLFQLPDITEKELQDRSKADWLLRLITVWQILWMVIQTALRGATRLAVTPLEIGVVAFACCAVVTYALSWNKPKGVQVPITILEVRGAGEQVFEALSYGELAPMTDLSQ